MEAGKKQTIDCKAKTRPVVFLDRDGTLNEEVGYIRVISDLRLIAGAAEAVKKLNDANIAAILVTNQTGAARGYYLEKHIQDLNSRLVALLAKDGARLDGIYYCPHLPAAPVSQYAVACRCRKPEVGMIEQAYSDHPDLDRRQSFVVGDKATDVELARNCGAKSVLVVTGYGEAVVSGSYQWKVLPDFQAKSIVDAVDWILEQVKSAKEKFHPSCGNDVLM